MALDIATLQAALVGYQAEVRKIEEKMAEIRKQLGGRGSATSNRTAADLPRTKRVLSAAARKRIAAAQKKRWAEHRAKQKAAAA
jgi:hypothetical protein